MKTNHIKNWTNYFFGVCAVSGMLLFTACGNGPGDETVTTTTGENYGYGVHDEDEVSDDDLTNLSDTATVYEPASNILEDQEGNELTKEQDPLQSNSTEGLNSAGHNIIKPENLDEKRQNRVNMPNKPEQQEQQQ